MVRLLGMNNTKNADVLRAEFVVEGDDTRCCECCGPADAYSQFEDGEWLCKRCDDKATSRYM